jgi:hypothetical protein
LAREAGLPDEVVRFALLNDEGCPVAAGALRNALLLHHAGEAFVSADDDTLGQLVAVPGGDGLRLSSRPDPTEFWFLAEGAAAPVGVEDDPLAWHERLLGRHPGDCPAAAGGVDLESAGAGLFRRLEGGGRVSATMLGAAGDAGMGSSPHLLTLDGTSRARLLASEGFYRHAVARRPVLRGATAATAGDGGLCMAMHLGLDHRRLLPPFLPVQRNQNGVFGALLRCCFGDLFGYLPRAVLNRPPGPRGADGDPWAEAGRVGTGHLLHVLIGTFAPRPDAGDAGRNLVVLGRALSDFAASPPAAFEEVARLHLWQAFGGWAARLDARLRAHGGQPADWADDARRALANLRAALTDPNFAVPWDLRRAFGPTGRGTWPSGWWAGSAGCCRRGRTSSRRPRRFGAVGSGRRLRSNGPWGAAVGRGWEAFSFFPESH